MKLVDKTSSDETGGIGRVQRYIPREISMRKPMKLGDTADGGA